MFEIHPKLKADTIVVGQFHLCLVLLHRDANYPWCVLVPKRQNVKEIHHLSQEDRVQLINESCHLSEVMTGIFAPETMNIAEMGNSVPQLHLHHVARYKTDKVWPASIWGASVPEPYDEAALAERLSRLHSSLVGEGFEADCVVNRDERTGDAFSP